jgi:hypothetical protein
MKLQAASGLSPSQVKSRVGQFSAYASTAATTPQRDSPAKMQSLTPPRASPPSPVSKQQLLRLQMAVAGTFPCPSFFNLRANFVEIL